MTPYCKVLPKYLSLNFLVSIILKQKKFLSQNFFPGAGRGGGQHMQSMQWLWQLKHLKGYYGIVLGDMVIFHIIISPACEIADTRYYRAWAIS